MVKKRRKNKASRVQKKKISSSSGKVKEVNWVLVLVMSVLFGYLGVDRFIMGRYGTGALKLFITIITIGILGWIWWLIDIILIATKYDFEGIRWAD